MEFKLTYNEKSQSWEPYKEPYKTIECETKEVYQFLVDALEHYKKRGQWIEKSYLLGTAYLCSLCGGVYGMPGVLFSYCPHCGAKMEVQNEID